MTALHAIMAVLAAWRLAELAQKDTIFNPIRARWQKRFAGRSYQNFLTCYRCTSFWISITVFATFYFVPFLNWPLGISMAVIVCMDVSSRFNYGGQRKIVVMPDVRQIDWGEYGPEEGQRLMREAFAVEPVGRNGGR